MTSPFDLTGRTALVTGGARGLGAAYVRALHTAGAAVVVAVAVAPAVVLTCITTVLEVPAGGWVLAGRLWPEVAAIVSFFVVAIVADGTQIRRVPRRT